MSEEQPLTLSVIWPGVDELPVLRANMSLIQIGTDNAGHAEDILLTIGHLSPPVLLGTAEEQEMSARALGAVSARPLIRVSLSRERLQELINGLVQAADTHDKATKEAGT